MSRRRYTDEEKTKFLAEFAQSEGNAAAFCRDQGLAYQTFLSWRRRSKGELKPARVSQPPEFVEVELPPGGQSPRPSEASPAVELVLGGGTNLRIYPSQPPRS